MTACERGIQAQFVLFFTSQEDLHLKNWAFMGWFVVKKCIFVLTTTTSGGLSFPGSSTLCLWPVEQPTRGAEGSRSKTTKKQNLRRIFLTEHSRISFYLNLPSSTATLPPLVSTFPFSNTTILYCLLLL